MNQKGREGDQSADSTRARWEEIYRRLDAVQQRIAHKNEPSAEQQKAILKARAKAMAQRPLPARSDLSELEIVEFRMAHETYGFESRFIREVYPLKEYCPIPCTPAYVFGLVNVRGQLLSVLDLKKFFGLASQELDNHNQTIILRYEPPTDDLLEPDLTGRAPHMESRKSRKAGNEVMEIGVLADALLDVHRVRRESLQPTLPTLTGLRNEFLLGITPEGVIVLDAEKLLSSRNIIVFEEVET
jgi:purine-binding chemotaxis protein CheW